MRRKFLSSILILATFIVVCVYVVIRAQGTQIDQDGNVVTTSILRVNSVPTDVTVYVNDQRAIKNENRVEWLQPGETKITLKKAGYRTWEKTVDLRAGVIEDIYAQLYPESLNFDKLTTLNIDKFFFSNNTDYVFYSVINAEKPIDNGLWKLKLKRNLLDIGELVPTKVYSYTVDTLSKLQTNNYNLKIADDGAKVLIDFPKLEEIYYIDLNNPVETSLKDILTFYPVKSEWLKNTNSIIASNGSLLISYDVNSHNQNLIYFSASKPINYTTSLNEVYYYRFDKSKLYNLNSNQTTEVVFPATYTTAELITNIFTASDNSKIIYTLEGTTLNFLDLTKKVYLPFYDVKSVLSVAPNGKGITYLSSLNEVKAIVFKDSIDQKAYTYNVHSVALRQEEILQIFYTPTSKNLIALTKDSKDSRFVWFMDSDGMNATQLIDKEKIAKDNVGIDSTGLSLYLLLTDEPLTAASPTLNSIYRFDLEAK